MKIGIVSSGIESFPLFHFLSLYPHDYVIYYDTLHAPYGSKNFSTSLKFVEEGIAWLLEQGCEKLIVPPVYELALKGKNDSILPLFEHYLLEEVFPYSLVGKIGLFGEFADLQIAQELLGQIEGEYSLTDNQKNIKKFSKLFHYWGKETGIFNPLLSKISWKSVLTNTVIKHELRYFKDANVDTVIPLNYIYLNAERTIHKFFNYKKIRFHGRKALEKVFISLVTNVGDTYSVHIHATDQKEALLKEKRLVGLLQKGKTNSIQWF